MTSWKNGEKTPLLIINRIFIFMSWKNTMFNGRYIFIHGWKFYWFYIVMIFFWGVHLVGNKFWVASLWKGSISHLMEEVVFNHRLRSSGWCQGYLSFLRSGSFTGDACVYVSFFWCSTERIFHDSTCWEKLMERISVKFHHVSSGYICLC